MAQKSKFFRVATEGATTDGRKIERVWIQQMAKNFDPKKYGARIWLEHYRGVMPDGPFKAYGDVLAIKSQEVEDGKLALFAQIEPLPELIAFNKKKQKIYTSIEVHPEFADTGEAYLTGIAVTDSPASLGTEVLTFAAQTPEASPFKGRKSAPQTLFSEAVEVELEFGDADDDTTSSKFSEGLKSLRSMFKGKSKNDDTRFGELLSTLEDMGEAFTQQAEDLSTQRRESAELKTTVEKLSTQLGDLVKKLGATEDHQAAPQRPAASGAPAAVLTDC